MGRTGFVLLAVNVAILATCVILHVVWFDAGGLGCDNRAAATDYDQCSDRADLVVALYLTAAFLLAGTALGFVSSRAGRLRAARRVR
jgi:hypothetical protein